MGKLDLRLVAAVDLTPLIRGRQSVAYRSSVCHRSAIRLVIGRLSIEGQLSADRIWVRRSLGDRSVYNVDSDGEFKMSLC